MNADQKNNAVSVSIPSGVLESIFDDCDRYDRDETGGRIVGVFERAEDGDLTIQVKCVIEAGPRARRTSSSFFQDGHYQAEVFRQIESSHPDIEHLGNWHTHHVNGFPRLSSGDIATYKRIVNHKKHNIDFFYALLVVARQPRERSLSRYRVRHYILFRGDDEVYEIKEKNIRVTQEKVIRPNGEDECVAKPVRGDGKSVRAKDNTIMPVVFPSVRPYWSKRANVIYWEGSLELVDGTSVEIKVPEIKGRLESECSYYQILVKNLPDACAEVIEEFGTRQFDSATEALRVFEKKINQVLYRVMKQKSGEK